VEIYCTIKLYRAVVPTMFVVTHLSGVAYEIFAYRLHSLILQNLQINKKLQECLANTFEKESMKSPKSKLQSR